MELNANDIDCLNTAKDLIEKHLDRHYTIPEIAKEVGINEMRLKKGFKQAFGMGILEFLTNARMEKAKLLLAEKRKSIKQIARSAGYKHISNFSTAFKRKYEQSPADFRKQTILNSNHKEKEETHSQSFSLNNDKG